jgi:SAM-dependent methyltransferase
LSYREGAERFYDLFGAKNDAPFYIELAHTHGNKALELGVGTARLAIQLARAEVETWGIDNSTHMLRAAEANLWEEPPEVRSRVHLELADARRFSLEESFGLIYFPSGSFDHILHRQDRLLALRNIKKHLAEGGVYAFDLAHVPELKADSGWFVQKRPLDTHRQVVRTGYHTMDPENRRMTLSLWYELYHDGRMLERYFESGEVYVHTPDGVRKLLEETGFEIDAEYGGHDWRPFTLESEMMLIVASPI